jgi:hypothetical protein
MPSRHYKSLSRIKVRFSDSALDEIVRQTKGYPYFLQEWGYQAWNLAPASPINI